MTAEMRRGSRASMPASGLTPGEALYATDRQALYAVKDDGTPAPAVIALDELAALVGAGVVSAQDYVLIHDADAVGVKEKKILVGELLTAMGAVSSGLLGQPNGVATLGSDGKVPTAQLPDAVLGALRYQGTWNASTNSPTIPAAASSNRGHYYVVAVAGTTSVGGETDWQVGDWLVSSGTVWGKVDNSDKVSSVAGKTGAVTLVKGDVGLGNVDNTSDANKPVSTAQQAALDQKANKTQMAYVAPTLLNGWANHSEWFPAAGYMKDELGFVHLTGLVRDGTAAHIFTLPAGYRPSKYTMFPVVAADAYGTVGIEVDGNVYLRNGATGFVSLDGILFKV